MKAQVALEYLILVGTIIGFISIVSAYVWQQNEVSTRLQQATIAINSITTAANTVYAQGPGAKTTVSVMLPVGYKPSLSYISENKTIVLKIYTPAGYSDIVGITKANVSGSLPTSEGLKILTFETIEGYVNISSS